jgi:Prokaryotic phospholipase A2
MTVTQQEARPLKRTIAVAVAALIGAAALVATLPAPADAKFRSCPTSEFCLYFNEDANGGIYHFAGDDPNLDNDLYQGEDDREVVGDTSRYATNNGTGTTLSDVIVYGLPAYRGARDCIRKGDSGALPRNWWNNIESYRWVSRAECTSAGVIPFDTSSTPPASPRERPRPVTVAQLRNRAKWIMNRTYSDFEDYKRKYARTRVNRRFDWTADGCSNPPGTDLDFKDDFTPACVQHDFGYRNFGGRKLGRNEDTRGWIDDRFLSEMRRICNNDVPWTDIGFCHGAAAAWWASLRHGGRDAFYHS